MGVGGKVAVGGAVGVDVLVGGKVLVGVGDGPGVFVGGGGNVEDGVTFGFVVGPAVGGGGAAMEPDLKALLNSAVNCK